MLRHWLPSSFQPSLFFPPFLGALPCTYTCQGLGGQVVQEQFLAFLVQAHIDTSLVQAHATPKAPSDLGHGGSGLSSSTSHCQGHATPEHGQNYSSCLVQAQMYRSHVLLLVCCLQSLHQAHWCGSLPNQQAWPTTTGLYPELTHIWLSTCQVGGQSVIAQPGPPCEAIIWDMPTTKAPISGSALKRFFRAVAVSG